MNNNTGSAKKQPAKSYELAYAMIADACRRFLEGKINEHRSYRFYTGAQVRFFITEQQYKLVRQMLANEGLADKDGSDNLMVNGKHLGEWAILPGSKRLNPQICLTLSPDFQQKHAIIKRFAQLAAQPLSPATKLHYCQKCGFPMVKMVDGEWICEDCLMKEEDLF